MAGLASAGIMRGRVRALRSEIRITNTDAVKVLRQRAQIALAICIAALLVAVSIGGTLLARRADENAGLSSYQVAATLLGRIKVQKRNEFMAIVRQHLDGTRITGLPASLAPGMEPAALNPSAAFAARSADLSVFIMSESQQVLAADNGLRMAGDSVAEAPRILAEHVIANINSTNQFVAEENLLSLGDRGGYVFAEPVWQTRGENSAAPRAGQADKGRPAMAIAVWLLDQRQLEPFFSEHGLLGLQLSGHPETDGQRTGIKILDNEGNPALYLSWMNPNVMTSQWMVLMPLISLALIGVLFAISKSLRFSQEAAGLVHEIEAAAYDRATRDPLTGLHNRSGFKMRLDEALEPSQGAPGNAELVGVIYIDLDRFKEVNDGFGHETGDKLLIAVTERLKETCGRDVTIARLGGDEFAVVVTGRGLASDIVTLGETISRELGRPFLLDTTEVVIGGSVGISIAPEDGKDATELVRRADISMYRAKTGGRGQAIRFHSSMEDDIRRRKMLEGELRHAIARNQLEVWYQPYMSSDGETLIGVEALMRWVHPTEGMISPAIFVPLAEETGQIVEIGAWAMRRAMQDALRWPGVHLAINVSPVQFRSKDLVGTTVAMIEEIGIERDRIEIEITEGVLMDDAEMAIEVIQGFRDARLHVALDDFGTGYASLSYLRRFPFDKLKVDQAFVRNLGVTAGSAAIIHSVIALGRSLGMTVHAEGVETLEHHIFLRAAGCHHFQGYYFSKPMNRDATDAFVASKSIGSLYSRRA